MLDKNEKIRLLQKLLTKSEEVTVENSSDPIFKNWKNLVERTFIKVFGKDTTEFEHFSELDFFYHVIVMFGGSDHTADHLRCFREDFKMLISSINQYIEEVQETTESEPAKQEIENNDISKVFISHASKDADIVEELIEILESIGLDSNQIFCTSFEGYGIELGESFLDSIKGELASDSLVIFILSRNFYESPVCLCEMGATWVLAKEHIPVLVPPLDYSDVKGVIPLTQGLKINDPLKLNSLKTKIEELFAIEKPLTFPTWERKRDRILSRIGHSIENQEFLIEESNSSSISPFIEYRGAKFKRKPSGGFEESPYCLKCEGGMFALENMFPFSCGSCGGTAGFKGGEIKKVLREVESEFS
jgi:hypothetical protein